IPAADPTTVHVVIVDGRVARVAMTRGLAPDKADNQRRHAERASFNYPRNVIAGVAFSPDGSLVAAGGIRGFVSLREVQNGKERLVLTVPAVKEYADAGFLAALAFSPD